MAKEFLWVAYADRPHHLMENQWVAPLTLSTDRVGFSALVTVNMFLGLVDHHPALGLPLGGTGIALWPVPSPKTPLKPIAELTERGLPKLRFWFGAFLDVARKGQAKDLLPKR